MPTRSSTKQERTFSPEATEALRREVPTFLQISPLLNSLLTGAIKPEGGAARTGVRAAAANALPAVESAGITAGLDSSALANLLQDLSPDDPAFGDILRQLSSSVSTSVPSIVDPRFALGLRPNVETQGSVSPSNAQIAAQIAPLILGGAAIAACWIALRLYGSCDPRFYLARMWVHSGLRRTRRGRLVAWAYSRFGRQFARSQVLCRWVKPLMDRAWKRGLKELGDG